MRYYTVQSPNFTFYLPEFKTVHHYLLAEIACGFPSPAQDYLEKIDLNEYLIRHKDATFFARAKGNSMVEDHILDGNLLIIDRSIKPVHNKIIIAVVDGEFTVKRIDLSKDRRITLKPANPKFKDIEISEFADFAVWGVVTHNIQPL